MRLRLAPSAPAGEATAGAGRARRLGFAEVYLGIGLLALLVARFVPFDLLRGLLPCPSLELLDLPCLTCGFTRAWMRLATGEIASAFAVSPLGALTFIALCAFVVFAIVRLTFGLAWPRLALSRRAGLMVRAGLVTVVLVNWAYLIFAHRVLGTWQ